MRMKLIRLAAIVALSSALTILIVGVVSAAPARSNDAAASSNSAPSSISSTADVTDTDDLSGTHSMTHPVALAISFFFSGTYSDVISLHNAGFGFGEIARAYFIAKLSNGSLTPQQVLDLAAGGMGWGEITKQYGFKPGKGNNLGAIMSGKQGSQVSHANPSGKGSSAGGGKPNCPGNSCNAPGKNKNKH